MCRCLSRRCEDFGTNERGSVFRVFQKCNGRQLDCLTVTQELTLVSRMAPRGLVERDRSGTLTKIDRSRPRRGLVGRQTEVPSLTPGSDGFVYSSYSGNPLWLFVNRPSGARSLPRSSVVRRFRHLYNVRVVPLPVISVVLRKQITRQSFVRTLIQTFVHVRRLCLAPGYLPGEGSTTYKTS